MLSMIKERKHLHFIHYFQIVIFTYTELLLLTMTNARTND